MRRDSGRVNRPKKPRVAGRNLVPTMRKPFDVLAEGLLLKNSRGDKTAIELFLAGVRGWKVGIRRRLDDGAARTKTE